MHLVRQLDGSAFRGGIIETKLPGRRRLACHARAGAGAHCGDVRPPGRAYVYFTYGITVPERRHRAEGETAAV